MFLKEENNSLVFSLSLSSLTDFLWLLGPRMGNNEIFFFDDDVSSFGDPPPRPRTVEAFVVVGELTRRFCC